MSDLTFIEKTKLERQLQMGGGYVLDFSSRTLAEFVAESTGRDIYHARYNYAGGSKANRLRAFWRQEPNHLVGKLTTDLLEYCRPAAGEPDRDRLFEARANKFPINQDSIFLYSRINNRYSFNQQYVEYSDEYKERYTATRRTIGSCRFSSTAARSTHSPVSELGNEYSVPGFMASRAV